MGHQHNGRIRGSWNDQLLSFASKLFLPIGRFLTHSRSRLWTDFCVLISLGRTTKASHFPHSIYISNPERIQLILHNYSANRQSNSTQPQENVNCRQLMASDNFDIELTNACTGWWLIQDCPPFFVSVEGVAMVGPTNLRCSDSACRYPDSIRFGVTVENLGCYSSANRIGDFASTTLLAAILLNVMILFKN